MDIVGVAIRCINEVGFPICVACVMMYQVYHMHKENHLALDALKKELSLLREAIAVLVTELGVQRRRRWF